MRAGESPFVDGRSPAARSLQFLAQGCVSPLSCLTGGSRACSIPLLPPATDYKRPNPHRPTNPSGKGVGWKLSLDEDPSTPTAQVGPGRGTQMHAMRPLLRTKEIFNSPPEGQGRYPKPEEAGKGGSGAAHGGPN